jgi:hypothetical protein
MRGQMIDLLTDSDLAFSPGGQTMKLGALCREFGEIEHAYLESFRHFKQDWSYHNTEAGLEGSISRIKTWYTTLDADMKATIAAIPEADAGKTVERVGGYNTTLETQLDIYLQALLIFFGKFTIYLRAMNKPLPKDIQDWIG